ncbi:MAG: hypothetical protein J6M21_06405 [Campylobacter sp.]|nr:hypothetical protein [Campylobacter sp.]
MKNFNTILAILVILYGLFSSGCSSKTRALNEVYIPVKCPLKMPLKPQNNGDFKSHKEMMIYYLECENIAIKCTGAKNE